MIELAIIKGNLRFKPDAVESAGDFNSQQQLTPIDPQIAKAEGVLDEIASKLNFAEPIDLLTRAWHLRRIGLDVLAAMENGSIFSQPSLIATGLAELGADPDNSLVILKVPPELHGQPIDTVFRSSIAQEYSHSGIKNVDILTLQHACQYANKQGNCSNRWPKVIFARYSPHTPNPYFYLACSSDLSFQHGHSREAVHSIVALSFHRERIWGAHQGIMRELLEIACHTQFHGNQIFNRNYHVAVPRSTLVGSNVDDIRAHHLIERALSRKDYERDVYYRVQATSGPFSTSSLRNYYSVTINHVSPDASAPQLSLTPVFRCAADGKIEVLAAKRKSDRLEVVEIKHGLNLGSAQNLRLVADLLNRFRSPECFATMDGVPILGRANEVIARLWRCVNSGHKLTPGGSMPNSFLEAEFPHNRPVSVRTEGQDLLRKILLSQGKDPRNHMREARLFVDDNRWVVFEFGEFIIAEADQTKIATYIGRADAFSLFNSTSRATLRGDPTMRELGYVNSVIHHSTDQEIDWNRWLAALRDYTGSALTTDELNRT